MADHHKDPNEKPGWADTPGFRRAFLIGLFALGAIAIIAGFVPAWKKDHPHFSAEAFPVFFALYGFAAFTFIVLVGQHLRKLVGREETYYDERE